MEIFSHIQQYFNNQSIFLHQIKKRLDLEEYKCGMIKQKQPFHDSLRGSYDLEDLEAKMVFFITKTLKNHNSKTINGRKVSFVAFESLYDPLFHDPLRPVHIISIGVILVSSITTFSLQTRSNPRQLFSDTIHDRKVQSVAFGSLQDLLMHDESFF